MKVGFGLFKEIDHEVVVIIDDFRVRRLLGEEYCSTSKKGFAVDVMFWDIG